MGSIYDIDHNKLAEQLTPPDLRGEGMLSWVQALIKPVITNYQVFLRYRKAKLYQLMITPQVCYLERLLNDKYDYTLRRIRIVDSEDKPPLSIYLDEELKPVALFTEDENEPVYIYTDGEAIDIKDDFIILVPVDITFSNDEMLQLVSGYRLAAMKPKIQRV